MLLFVVDGNARGSPAAAGGWLNTGLRTCNRPYRLNVGKPGPEAGRQPALAAGDPVENGMKAEAHQLASPT